MLGIEPTVADALPYESVDGRFCERLHADGYVILRLPEHARSDFQDLRDRSAEFFAMPDHEKVLLSGDSAGFGGEGVGYREKPEHDTEFLETYLTREGSVFPDMRDATNSVALADAVERVHRRLLGVAQTLLELCAAQMRLPMEAIRDAVAMPCGDHPAGSLSEQPPVGSTLLRLCHYYARAAPDASDPEPTVLFLPHTDSTLLTLSPLCPASAGLQLLMRRSTSRGGDAWLEVERRAHSLLDVEVHAGDFLDILSRGYFAALRHRVVRPSGGGARVSCPLLLRPREAWRCERGWLKYLEEEDEDSESDDGT